MIIVENLSKEFKLKKGLFKKNKQDNSFFAVKDISFKVEDGECVAFIGRNGAGKSTTIKMLTGIIEPTSGNISINGLSPTKNRKQVNYQIGCLFGQKSSLWLHLSAMESYKLFGTIYDIEEKVLKDRIDYLTEMFEAKDIINVPVKNLSLGQRMKCEIIAAMLSNPKILFLDEPTIGLDIVSKEKIRYVISKLNKEYGTTIFLTSHDVEDISNICERVIIIDKGEVVIDSSITELKRKYSNDKMLEITYTHNMKEAILSKINMHSCDCSNNYIKELYDTNNIIFEENKVKIRVNKNKYDVNKVLELFMSLGEVVNIEIKEKSLEDIIKDVYNYNY